jgi:SpoVK/Ycf46/Vps4 family AAA+-type ATPase
LDTLVEEIAEIKIAVILCGYKFEMDEMIRQQNRGLSRRFDYSNLVFFDDFTNEELMIILKNKAKSKKLLLDCVTAKEAADELGKKRVVNFGNAGEVDNMLQTGIKNNLKRVKDESKILQKYLKRKTSNANTNANANTNVNVFAPLNENENENGLELELEYEPDVNKKITIEDLTGKSDAERNRDPFDKLDDLVNMKKIKEQLIIFKKKLMLWKIEGGQKPEIGNFLFVGPSGAGKTELAYIIGDIFNRLGVLATNNVVMTSGKKMVGKYIGETPKVVIDLVGQASGGVLFIDEAYGMMDTGTGGYGEEAMVTLLELLTIPENKNDRVIVIMAGYNEDIETLCSINQGITGRFRNVLEFEPWDSEACLSLVKKKAADDNFTFSDSNHTEAEILTCIQRGFKKLKKLPKFANARILNILLISFT